ncbi:hypothetical protein AVEN_23442-1 [Araneus ventricosus]|uniref:Uncharacterized protein n=1 Tax=Araneus ventricosus TaxID=182803 RepID=A0A4Y2E817_ARAVE|nr:hypothetical protein AVEN_23442-1 [Araneus ventricosus]
MIEFLGNTAQTNSMGEIKNVLKDKKLDIKLAQIVKSNFTKDNGNSRNYVLMQHFPKVDEDFTVDECKDFDEDTEDFTIDEIEAVTSRPTSKSS